MSGILNGPGPTGMYSSGSHPPGAEALLKEKRERV